MFAITCRYLHWKTLIEIWTLGLDIGAGADSLPIGGWSKIRKFAK